MSRSALIDRRACLKGMGAALALPLMDAMGWADTVAGEPGTSRQCGLDSCTCPMA